MIALSFFLPKKVFTNQSCETDLGSAYEYMFRKDFHQNWQAELKERFGFWTEAEAVAQLSQAGFKVERHEKIKNEWIETNRLKGKVALYDNKTGEKIDYPDYQIILVGKKR